MVSEHGDSHHRGESVDTLARELTSETFAQISAHSSALRGGPSGMTSKTWKM
jgi:hypothetical protein